MLLASGAGWAGQSVLQDIRLPPVSSRLARPKAASAAPNPGNVRRPTAARAWFRDADCPTLRGPPAHRASDREAPPRAAVRADLARRCDGHDLPIVGPRRQPVDLQREAINRPPPG